ncbi:MAG: CPBP family intramembrane metalloprotease [Lachnospiraceae bacterium]|nr:CPBP family intramembrane metalloprotease [Lachnospiraceae bacterium]
MVHRDTVSVQKTILIFILVVFVGVIFTLDILPKGISWGFAHAGIKLDSNDLGTKYGMGIIVRLFGLALLLPILFHLSDMRIFTYRIDKTYFGLSWMFFVYIVANLEIDGLAQANPGMVLLMILESLAIGFYEEILFRGVLLRQFTELFGNTHNRTICAVFMSSILFGLIHLKNFRTGVGAAAVLTQVGYACIIGVFFSALLLRTNLNLLWCCILHSLYDMAAGFGDFAVRQMTTEEIANNNTPSARAYVINLCLFIPLLLYAVFLLRKKEVSNN